ncbi:hypothetical protein ACU686_39650 [Yinghuangia aomiensis]
MARIGTELERLARVLHSQIAAMQLTVKMASDKTQETDDANRAEMSRILADIQRYSARPCRTRPGASGDDDDYRFQQSPRTSSSWTWWPRSAPSRPPARPCGSSSSASSSKTPRPPWTSSSPTP